jgi:hypothetical protein
VRGDQSGNQYCRQVDDPAPAGRGTVALAPMTSMWPFRVTIVTSGCARAVPMAGTRPVKTFTLPDVAASAAPAPPQPGG